MKLYLDKIHAMVYNIFCRMRCFFVAFVGQLPKISTMLP